jgi:hypothetical protein
MREIELITVGGANEGNREILKGLLDSYQGMLFPGMVSKSKKSTYEETAKKALAEEVKQVYVVKPTRRTKEQSWKEAAKSGDAVTKRFAAQEQRDEMRAQNIIRNKAASRRKKKLPKGTVMEGKKRK